MEVEKKYISVDTLRTVLQTEIADVIATHEDYEEAGFSRDALDQIIENIHKEEVAPVIHAKWIEDTFCSNCNYYDENEYGRIIHSGDKKHCPECGAKMDLEI